MGNAKSLLLKKIEREQQARKQAEELLENKSRELYFTNSQLQAVNNHLEVLVKERTMDLEKSRDEAISANRAKSQFLANMSHEIRTPLHGILGLLSILKEEKLSPEQIDYIQVIEHSGDLLLSIINDILDFSRIEAGKLNIEQKSFEIRKCLEGVCIPLSQQAAAKNINFISYVDHDLPLNITNDETRFRQVLINLIGNAIKFTPRGDIFVNLSKEGLNLRVDVVDTGVGIPADKISQVFRPFSQSDVSDTRKYGGSGLGLSISKNLIEAMGGNLEVESEETKGSKFSFYIPMNQVSEVPKKMVFKNKKTIYSMSSSEFTQKVISKFFKGNQIQKVTCVRDFVLKNDEIVIFDHTTDQDIVLESIEHFLSQNRDCHNQIFIFTDVQNKKIFERYENLNIVLKPFVQKSLYQYFSDVEKVIEVKNVESPVLSSKGFKILLVEDNLVNIKIASLLLKGMGIDFDVAENGKEAVEKFQKTFFNIILMDCQMPVMDGYEATQKIRNLGQQGKDVKVIAMTANAFRATQEKCYEAGMNDFLTKPFTAEDLKKMINTWRVKNAA
jgi:two-component system sensor histidine kinase/response regulator